MPSSDTSQLIAIYMYGMYGMYKSVRYEHLCANLPKTRKGMNMETQQFSHNSSIPSYRFIPGPIPNLIPIVKSSINTLRVSINLQPLLRQLNILQELQRHPHQMALDLIKLLAHNLHRLEQIVQMPGLTRAFSAEESVVVLEVLDVVVRVRVEQVAEDFGVGGGARGPHFPELVVERVADHGVVLVAAFPDVVAVAGRLGVGVFGGVELLGVEQAEVLAPEHAAEGGGVVTGGVGLTVHHRGEGSGVFHYDGELAVVEA